MGLIITIWYIWLIALVRGIAVAKLYYGDGKCSITEDAGVKIIINRYKGAIIIDDKTSHNFAITAQKNGIVIFAINPDPGELGELFEYTGEFKITSVKVPGNTTATIHRVMDYTELLTGNTESMTINTEDLKVTHNAGGRVNKTELKQPYLKNLQTSDGNRTYYLKNGDSYTGYYHISLVDNSVMTGGDRDSNSLLLYIKQTDGKFISTYNPTHVPLGLRLRKKQDAENRRNKRRKR